MSFFKIFIISTLSFIGTFFCYADNSAEYHIKSYDVNIDINSDKSVDIRETLFVDFSKPSNGFIRYIQTNPLLTGNIKRIFSDYDPSFKLRIEDAKAVGLPKLVVNSDGLSNIRLRDSENFITGERELFISYKVYGAIQQTGSKYLFFWDLVGEKLDTYCDNINFKINLSKSLDFSTNDFIIDYPQNYSGSEIKILGSTIQGSIHEKIPSFRGLKVFLKIPDSYFEKNFKNEIYLFLKENLMTVMIIFFIIIVISFGFRLSKDPDFDKGL